MLLSTNLISYYKEFGLERMLDIYAEAGYRALDFNLDIGDFIGDLDKAHFDEIREKIESRGLTVGQTHAPFGSNFPEEDRTEARFAEIAKSLEYSSYLGAELVVVHPKKAIGYDYLEEPERHFKENLDFYKALLPYAKKYGVKIAIENIFGLCTETGKGLNELLDALNDESFVVCYDVGHANYTMSKHPEFGISPDGMIREIGARLACTHIHDNDGLRDAHTLPFYGNIDWDAVCRAFAEVGYSGNLNYEAGYFVKTVPVELRPEAAKYMAKVGYYLIDKINSYK